MTQSYMSTGDWGRWFSAGLASLNEPRSTPAHGTNLAH
jgi:hypothetical protein